MGEEQWGRFYQLNKAVTLGRIQFPLEFVIRIIYIEVLISQADIDLHP